MVKKIASIIIIITITLSMNTFNYTVQARNPDSGHEGQYTDTGTSTTNQYIDNHGIIKSQGFKPQNLDDVQNAEKLKSIGNIIIGIVQTIGSILSVLVLIVMGLKYMMGSVEEKAEYKKSLMPYVIGAIMVFAITNILGIIASISSKLF